MNGAQTVDPSAFYPSFAGEGREEVEIPSPPAFKGQAAMEYPSHPVKPTTMQIRELPPYLLKVVNEGLLGGDSRAADYLLRVIAENDDIFDTQALSSAKVLAEEARKARTDEDKKILRERANKFLGSLRVAKRK